MSHKRKKHVSIIMFGVILILVLFFQFNIAKPTQTLHTEADVASTASSTPDSEASPITNDIASNTPEQLFTYIEIINSCGPYFLESCARVRGAPGTSSPIVGRLRNGVVLAVAESVEKDGHTWYKIAFERYVLYPNRISGDWYVTSEVARPFTDRGTRELQLGMSASSSKRIIVDRSDELLYAYDGDTLFMEQKISTGLELTPTPRGTFSVYKMTPSRYMQGPIPDVSDQVFDLPGVPWNLYFTPEGAVIHGAYWHDHFGSAWSHGCVNLPPDKAKELYAWAELGMTVIVRE